MMRQQFTNNPSNPLYLACQVMKRALLHYRALHANDGYGTRSIADEAIRKAESVAGVKFDVSPLWLDEWIGLKASDAVEVEEGSA